MFELKGSTAIADTRPLTGTSGVPGGPRICPLGIGLGPNETHCGPVSKSWMSGCSSWGVTRVRPSGNSLFRLAGRPKGTMCNRDGSMAPAGWLSQRLVRTANTPVRERRDLEEIRDRFPHLKRGSFITWRVTNCERPEWTFKARPSVITGPGLQCPPKSG